MENLTAHYGNNVFNDAVMRERLPKLVYKSLKKTIDLGLPLDPSIAEVVANAMKDWAIEKGATHFTHWFQPLTGITAEKHDSFISPTSDGKVILEFSGKELIKGEPDASSFPSGGLRATFEARGYTAWDCTSPAFLKDDSLCIPTAFCSYTGEALDQKTPLLRSMEAVSKEAIKLLRLFGNTTSQSVSATVGPEQEYFLIDKDLYEQRKDLMFTGRTLFGSKPPKGQELEDHYFGNLKERISDYMKELDEELWSLGIAAKTKHNEVAPAQHELAPIFSTANIATDHNQLTMEFMKKVALRHGLVCLLHEKPFAGVNGSGKHNNWSLSTDDGINLLEPGKTPLENTQFLTVLVAVIKAVDEYGDLLRMSVASAGNDHRLGANEAPPAIISIYLGDLLADVLEQIESGSMTNKANGSTMQIGVTTLPTLPKDSSDRNRTSPFAFTGNKFEFRMVGSTASIAAPNVILNTIVAETLSQISAKLEKATDFNAEVWTIIKDIIKNHKRIIFNGNNYAEEWVVEAAKRGLPNLKSTVEAIPALITEKAEHVLTSHNVLTKEEIESRYEILLENYSKTINIEALTMLEIAKKQIQPAVIDYTKFIADSINSIKATGIAADVTVEAGLLTELCATLASFKANTVALEAALDEIASIEGAFAIANAYHAKVVSTMVALRADGDKLEGLVSENYWPLPSYADLLFRV